MIAQGILREGEPIELLDGLLIRKDRSKTAENPRTVGHHHAWVVDQLGELNPDLRKSGCFIRLQQPLTIQPDNEPEPDASIVRGTSADFRERHPSATDALCVIEVADSSLHRDRTTKHRVYAEAGIPHYVLINLVGRVIEVYTRPDRRTGRYDSLALLKPGETLQLPTAAEIMLDVPVDKLLP
jgi:Uma2 family endonuclease